LVGFKGGLRSGFLKGIQPPPTLLPRETLPRGLLEEIAVDFTAWYNGMKGADNRPEMSALSKESLWAYFSGYIKFAKEEASAVKYLEFAEKLARNAISQLELEEFHRLVGQCKPPEKGSVGRDTKRRLLEAIEDTKALQTID